MTFINNNDGTVTDSDSKLMWQKDTGNNGDPLDWHGALAHCEDLELGGHTDWRLPTIRELQSIIDYGICKPAIDSTLAASSVWYWSSTSYADNPGYAWSVNFSVGNVNLAIKGSGHFIRAVRNITPEGENK